MYAHLERSTDFKAEITPIVVFLAFSIESYLNSIGARKIQIWDELERLPWKSKVIILHKTAGKDPDWGNDPLQFAGEIFKIRDQLAHGKPERVVGPLFEDPSTANEYLQKNSMEPEWYKKITKEWAIKAKERFRILMIYLANLFSLHESDHLLSSTGGLLIDDEADA
jgi:hypothetical protein